MVGFGPAIKEASLTMPSTIRLLVASDPAGWDALWQGYLRFYESDVPADVVNLT